MEREVVVFTLIYTTSKCRQDLIGTKCNYAISYLDNAMFNFDKCESKK